MIAMACSVTSGAGEIPGLPPQLPPSIDPRFAISFSNDFLGRGGSVDDFRTAQLIVNARFGERWSGVVDHSTLTLESTDGQGRVDQFSTALGYRLIDASQDSSKTLVVAGGGLRSTGNFAGERMQNGFHRIVGSEISVLPYVAGRSTDLTAWATVDHYATIRAFGADDATGGWRLSYWLRGATLLGSGGQWDNALGACLAAARGPFDIWLGARRDWRSGYDQDVVQAATAAAEDDLAVVLGIRMGALVLETVQQTHNDASYGQLRLLSDASQRYAIEGSLPRLGLGIGFLLPDVQLQLAGRYRPDFLAQSTGAWQPSIVADLRTGEPQYRDNPELYTASRQISVGVEWERPLPGLADWISGFGSTGIGWRSEQLLGDGRLAGSRSATVNRPVVVIGAGTRVTAATLSRRWRYRLELSLSGWVPLTGTEVSFAGSDVELQQPAVGIFLGMAFDYLASSR